MSNNEHPFTPPPELVQQWIDNDNFSFVSGTYDLLSITKDRLNSVIAQAAQWGADQELEACCEFMQHEDFHGFARELRAARRPKPPSLKEQGRQALERISNSVVMETGGAELHVLKAIVESLPD